MIIKTHRDVTSSLRGSGFRRVTFDGHTRSLRAIGTLRALYAQNPHAEPLICLTVGVRTDRPSDARPEAALGRGDANHGS